MIVDEKRARDFETKLFDRLREDRFTEFRLRWNDDLQFYILTVLWAGLTTRVCVTWVAVDSIRDLGLLVDDLVVEVRENFRAFERGDQ